MTLHIKQNKNAGQIKRDILRPKQNVSRLLGVMCLSNYTFEYEILKHKLKLSR